MSDDLIDRVEALTGRKILEASLPRSFGAILGAIMECERLDEAASWTCKLDALLAYSKMYCETEVEAQLRSLKIMALRRAGELLLQFDARGGDQSKSRRGESFAPISRAEAAEEAGLSRSQARDAATLARMPGGLVKEAVNARPVPGAHALAQQARAANQPARRGPPLRAITLMLWGRLGQITKEEMVDPATIARAMERHMREDIARNGRINLEYLAAVVQAVRDFQKDLQAASEDTETKPAEVIKATRH